jgi:hypothetical protein
MYSATAAAIIARCNDATPPPPTVLIALWVTKLWSSLLSSFLPLYVNCNNLLSIMVTTHGVNTAAKIQKHGAAKAAKIINRHLCPHGNSSSPSGNNKNLHIVKLNLNCSWFANVLVTLGTLD